MVSTSVFRRRTLCPSRRLGEYSDSEVSCAEFYGKCISSKMSRTHHFWQTKGTPRYEG